MFVKSCLWWWKRWSRNTNTIRLISFFEPNSYVVYTSSVSPVKCSCRKIQICIYIHCNVKFTVTLLLSEGWPLLDGEEEVHRWCWDSQPGGHSHRSQQAQGAHVRCHQGEQEEIFESGKQIMYPVLLSDLLLVNFMRQKGTKTQSRNTPSFWVVFIFQIVSYHFLGGVPFLFSTVHGYWYSLCLFLV